ncbi:MAG: class I SAM-dependent methyltransferase, partial [Desulfobacterota bacterium]|nr:class I SAM-dependent methyltransferase [Thermodesulfobacteriota bacterium]
QRRFAFEWKRYPEYLEEEERHVFLEETQIKPELFQNRLTLDAGCGMGRFTRIAAALGAEVVGIDASDSVFRAARITMQFDRAHMVQADIMRLPFRDNGFDIIYSLGVLHHTPDTRAAFSALVKKLKTGGLCSIWVYGTAGRYCNFRTNPLKPERARYLTTELLFRLYWLGVLLREHVSRLLRRLTVHIPHPILYAACYILGLVGAVPFLKYFTFSVHSNMKVRVLENFDWLAPPFQHHHTKEEVLAWFCEEGLTPVAILPHGFIPKVGIVGEKRPVIALPTICR